MRVCYPEWIPDSPPTLPPTALADGVCSAFAALAIMIALYEREVLGGTKGQIIDISLYEPLLRLMESYIMEYSVLGLRSKRMGSQISSAAPRNLYQTKDGRWISLSGGTQSIVENIFRAIGRPELITDPRFCNNSQRVQYAEELNIIIGEWIGRHSQEEAIKIFLKAQAVTGPIYEIDQIFEDEHFKFRETIVEIEDDDLNVVKVPNVFAKFSRTPGAVRFSGGPKGGSNKKIYCELLGLSHEELLTLQKNEVI